MKITVKIQDRTFEVQVGDLHARPIPVEIDGETLEVWPEELPSATPGVLSTQSPAPSAIPVHAAGVGTAAAACGKAGAVSAPIPGVIIEIKVKEGDQVAYGQELCVLEAMKMKNSIRAGHAGKVEKIHTAIGEQVQQGKLLMEVSEKAA